MSSTLRIPVENVLVKYSTDDGERLELNPAITCTQSLLVTPEGIRLVPYWGLQMFVGGTYELFITDNPEDSFYQKEVIFVGFRSTALKIVEFLGLEEGSYDLS